MSVNNSADIYPLYKKAVSALFNGQNATNP